MTMTSTVAPSGSRLTQSGVLLFTLAVVGCALWIGTGDAGTTVATAYCDTTRSEIRCTPEGEPTYVVVHEDGLWQDAQHVWRRGLPDCLAEAGDDVGPVRVAVVEGSDDGMSWSQVVWVGCP